MRLKVAAVNAAEWVRREREVKAILGCGIDAIDIRIQSLRRGPSADEMRLANWARTAGVEVHAHSWVGSRGPSGSSNATAQDGAQQGLYAVASVAAMGASRFAVNAERDVWRGEEYAPGKFEAHGGAVDFLDSFADVFHNNARAAHLDYVGFAVPSVHYQGDADIPDWLQLRFGRVCVMAYQSSLGAVQAVVQRAADYWLAHAEPPSLEPWVGCGRIDDKGRVVGSAQASVAVARERRALTWYVGFGAEGQLVQGHKHHPPIIQLVRELKPEVRA
jgi:hypothetical protein